MRKLLLSIVIFCIGAVVGIVVSGHGEDNGSHYGLYKDILPELSRDPNSPIQYNKETEEYQLKYEVQEGDKKVTRSYVLYYSPFTGERLTSGRSKLFTKPSKRDIQSISTRIQGAKTLEDIEQRLGKPDSILNDLSGSDIKTQYKYNNLSESTELIVQLHNDGKLSFYYSGKYKEKNK